MSTLKVTNIKSANGISALSIADGTGVVGANKFTDLAGTGAPDFPNGLTLAGNTITGNITGVTLDDYEEGSVTITTATPGTSGSITLTSGRRTLFYTKIGRVVTLSGMLQVGGYTSPVGDIVTLSPLPFVAASNVSGFEGRTGNAMPWRPSGTTGFPEYASGQISEGSSALVMYTDASTWASTTVQLVVNVTYVVS